VSPDVNPRRAYNSANRLERAAANRRAVLDAARRAFLAHGYASSSIPAIAADAGVSAEFVYKAFGAKPALLKAVFDRSVTGDDDPVALQERPDVRRLAGLTDGAAVLEGFAEMLGTIQVRVAPVYLLTRDAAAADPAAEPIFEQMDAERLAGMKNLAAQLIGIGAVRDGLTHSAARDILWTLNSPQLYELLVLRRGWSPDRYVAFVRDALKAALLP
jgi:AcrR family transcriptional regulator